MPNKPEGADDVEPERERFMRALRGETPRGEILIAAQFADIMLMRLLTTASIPREIASKLLDDFSSPLGTFSTRIMAAYAFGLLPDDKDWNLYWNLEQLRKVRNYCAHTMEAITFDDDKVRSHLENLGQPPSVRVEESKPELIVRYRIAYVLGSLSAWCTIVEHLTEHGLHRFVARDWMRMLKRDSGSTS